jgi:hypothetical protein
MDRMLADLASAVARLGAIDPGYPLDENRVLPPVSSDQLSELGERMGSSAPQLVQFYAYCNGFSLPDVHVGYFALTVELVLAGEQRGDGRLDVELSFADSKLVVRQVASALPVTSERALQIRAVIWRAVWSGPKTTNELRAAVEAAGAPGAGC